MFSGCFQDDLRITQENFGRSSVSGGSGGPSGSGCDGGSGGFDGDVG